MAQAARKVTVDDANAKLAHRRPPERPTEATQDSPPVEGGRPGGWRSCARSAFCRRSALIAATCPDSRQRWRTGAEPRSLRPARRPPATVPATGARCAH
jgi:hypothetical protein